MTDSALSSLSHKLDNLIQICDQLRSENQALREKENTWLMERSRLIEKNELARSRVEAMITRLKTLESES